jgi:purine-binding chemotaxis protein CheW
MDIAQRKNLTGARFLSFTLDREQYCLSIANVKEIMGLIEITRIPQTPPFIRGVINLRGKIIPVIDLRLKFGLPERGYDERTCIIVVEFAYEGEPTLMGIIVDTTHEVINIPEEKISRMPYINAKIKSEYIRGVAETGDSIKIVLDIARVLSDEEFVLLKDVEAKAN